jgi:hypothetical protein
MLEQVVQPPYFAGLYGKGPEGVGWIHLPQDRFQWWAALKVLVMGSSKGSSGGLL